jgi:hypothetical protein
MIPDRHAVSARLLLVVLPLLVSACGPTDELYDFDGDGSLDLDDCSPQDSDRYPDAEDTVDEAGIDENCDGLDGVDADGDRYASVASGGADCNDGDPDLHPGAVEEPDNGEDEDCDGDVLLCDADGDGVDAVSTPCKGTDCDDSNVLVYPDADELCNGIDDNCNGLVPGN